MRRFLLIALLTILPLARIHAITISVSSSDASCGNPTGWAEVGWVSGGVTPYTYAWSTGATNYFIQHLSPGTYTVTVSDASGSTASSSVTIGNSPSISTFGMYWIRPNSLPTHPCTDHCNGTAYLNTTALNGQAPYAINILFSNNPAVSQGTFIDGTGLIYPTLEQLCTNDQLYLMVSDSYGCTGNLMGPQTYPPNSFAFNPTIQGTCTGSSNGRIQLDFPNNQGISYSLSYSGPGGYVSNSGFTGTVTINNLPAGTYTFNVVEDLAQNCDTNFIVTVPDLGTNCGLIAGNVWLDTTRNCQQDANEPGLAGRIIEFSPGPYFATTDSSGHYQGLFPFNSYSAVVVGNPALTSVCSPPSINLSFTNDTISNVNFGDSAVAPFDLSVSITNGPARPGFSFDSWGYLYNNSYLTADTTTITVNYDPLLTPAGSSVPYTVISPGQLQLTLNGCNGFNSRPFRITFQVPANPALIGSVLITSVTASSLSVESNTANNTTSFSQVIVGSFDPNEKTSWPSRGPLHNYFTDVDSVLRYTVQCQNTGTDTAFNIVVIDTLDHHLDLSTFEWQGSSHPASWKIGGSGILTVRYDNILLPDSNIDESHSHAQFGFTIQPKPIAQLPMLPFVINNKAEIYFDFNPPVTTNTAFNTFDISVGMNSINELKNIFAVTPNPAHQDVFASVEDHRTLRDIVLLDLTGRIVCTIPGELYGSRAIQLPPCKPGTYLLSGNCVETGKRLYTRLLIY